MKRLVMEEFLYKNTTEKIIGAAMEVHNTLGCGFQEVIFQRALAYEFSIRAIRYEREFTMQIYYKGKNIGTRRVDFLIESKISLEIKAVSQLEDVHLSQALNYLEVYNLQVGLLINFGARKLEFKRLRNAKYDHGKPISG